MYTLCVCVRERGVVMSNKKKISQAELLKMVEQRISSSFFTGLQTAAKALGFVLMNKYERRWSGVWYV